MKFVTAAELKRRGMAALEEGLPYGPVHITKHNKAAAVVLSEKDYALLSRSAPKPQGRLTAVQWLLGHAARKGKSKTLIDRELRKERDAWK